MKIREVWRVAFWRKKKQIKTTSKFNRWSADFAVLYKSIIVSYLVYLGGGSAHEYESITWNYDVNNDWRCFPYTVVTNKWIAFHVFFARNTQQCVCCCRMGGRAQIISSFALSILSQLAVVNCAKQRNSRKCISYEIDIFTHFIRMFHSMITTNCLDLFIEKKRLIMTC